MADHLREDEAEAARLLASLLTQEGCSNVRWVPGKNPPDLTFFVENETWAVEVTRVDQRVGTPDANQSRRNMDTKYLSLGKQIKQRLKDLAKRSYVLVMPTCPPGAAWTKWKRELIRKIVVHVESSNDDLLLADNRRAGLFAQDQWPGNEIFIMGPQPSVTPGGAHSADIAANQEIAIEDGLWRKHSILTTIGACDQRVLIMINDYFFFEPTTGHDEASRIASRLAKKYQGIDRVYFQIGRDLRRIS